MSKGQMNRLVRSALAATILWLLLAGGSAVAQEELPAGEESSDPLAPMTEAAVEAAAAPVETFYQAHVLMPRDFTGEWSAAERQIAWDVGLPVPDVITTTNVFALAGPRPTASQSPLQRESLGSEGWRSVYRQTFDSGFPITNYDRACRVVKFANELRYRWGSGSQQTFAGTRAAASPLLGMATGGGGYPDDALLQFVCVFDHVQAAQNLMVQFALRLNQGSDGDTFFVGISTDGATFYGRRWRNTQPVGEGDHAWAAQRLFAPFLQTQTSGGRVAVLWEFRSDSIAPPAQDAWLDEIEVEQYIPPLTASACSSADPVMRVPGAPGSQLVSKGVNLPPYPAITPSGLAGHVARLRQSDVQWVRLEWQAPLRIAGSVAALIGAVTRLNYIDLRHYDALLEQLCAADHPIGVLGLLDYWALPDQEWQRTGRIGDAYLEAMTAITDLLVRYYADRTSYWEIWNEPDFQATYLAAGEYARLLTALSATVKQADARAQVVFGGLASADWVAAGYFSEVVRQLPTDPVPYDIFAIHPYPSQEFRHAGRLIRDPSYLQYHAPTVLERFMEIMRKAGHAPRPIWITEIGWNRAADSSNPATLHCQAVYETMVTGVEQAAFLPQQFDILFKEVAWEAGIPAVTKVFWYQYMDVGLAINDSGCRGRRSAGGPVYVVDWWFGLYSGTDWFAGVFEPQPNLVECSFRAYPDPVALSRCLPAGAGIATLPDAETP